MMNRESLASTHVGIPPRTSSATRRCASWPERKPRREPVPTATPENENASPHEVVDKASTGLNKDVLHPVAGLIAQQEKIDKQDGARGHLTEWNGMKKKPDLWQPQGNCFVYLNSRGESKRGPSFSIPLEALQKAQCYPLLDKFLVQNVLELPTSEAGSHPEAPGRQELYIPAPAKRYSRYTHYLITRNFLAWTLDQSLVGVPNLGRALVGLLNSMNEFRSMEEDNVNIVTEYMHRKGYTGIKNNPDHALAVLFFAEHFRLRGLWIEAFAHCVGMHDRLSKSPEFKHVSLPSRTLINTAQKEMSLRLDSCGERLSTFLSLEDVNFGFSDAAKTHLNEFRSFLEKFHIVELGNYPPPAEPGTISTFPKKIYAQMFVNFKKLYEYLADETDSPEPALGGICVLQNVQAFDRRHNYEPLAYSLPLLPLPMSPGGSTRSRPSSMLSFNGHGKKSDRTKPDERLITVSELLKATNSAALDCTLVRAYRNFEQETALSEDKSDKSNIPVIERRKVRWVLVYAIYQTLLSAIKVPEEVRDKQNIPYNLSIRTFGCPPWREERKSGSLLQSCRVQEPEEDYFSPNRKRSLPSSLSSCRPSSESLQPDIDYRRTISPETVASAEKVSRSPVRRAFSNIGSISPLKRRVSEMQQKLSYSEIIIKDCGNGTKKVDKEEGVFEHASTRTSSSDRVSVSCVSRGSIRHTDQRELEGIRSRSPSSFYSDAGDDEKDAFHQLEFDVVNSVREAHKAIPLFDEVKVSRESMKECLVMMRVTALNSCST